MDENDRLQGSAERFVAPEDRHCPSDIYDCAACGKALSYAVDPEGEALDGCGELVCLGCALAYMVDMATGELRRAPALLKTRDAEIERLTAERAELLAPAEDVDLDNVLGMSGTLTAMWATPSYDRTPGDRASAERLAGNLATCAPAMAREIARLRVERAGLTAERDAIAQALDDDCAPDIDGQQVKTMADRIGALLGRWQDESRGALCAGVPDPLDLTLAEVAQAVNQLTDQADEQIAALTAERDAARREAEERRLILGRISSWCHVMGRALCPKAGSADTYGDGVRAMKAEIGAMLAADKATS